MERFAITDWCQMRIRQMLGEQPRCLIDATAGTGKDTLFLCNLLGEDGGEVLSMDIQKIALEKTKARLIKNGYKESFGELPEKSWAVLQDISGTKSVRLIFRGHEHIGEYFPSESVDLIMFNLGYLPGGDHSLTTRPDTTLPALEKALSLLKVGGLLSLMIYSGGDSGFEEKEQVLTWLKGIDPRRYMVLVESFYNRPNNPPLPVFVRKLI